MELVCINCPRGCHLTAEKLNDQIKVTGNACPRGETYAINEMTNPLRTVTTTVKIESKFETCLPVITSSQIPKSKIMDVMLALKNTSVKAPVKINDVILENVCGLNVNIISSKSILE